MEKRKYIELGSRSTEDQRQIRTSNTWIEVLQPWLINTVYHLLVKNNKGEGRGAYREGAYLRKGT